MRTDKKYVPNLQQIQTLCARNYALLSRLLPLEYKQGAKWLIPLNEQLKFLLQVTSTSRYTEELTLTQESPQLPKFLAAQISFRLYHDAQMVEVIAYQKQTRIRQSYSYPNPKLHHKDEKLQINKLLKEWLNMAVEAQNKQAEPALISNN